MGGGGGCKDGFQYFSVTAYWTNVMNQFSYLSSGSPINIDLANNFAIGTGNGKGSKAPLLLKGLTAKKNTGREKFGADGFDNTANMVQGTFVLEEAAIQPSRMDQGGWSLQATLEMIFGADALAIHNEADELSRRSDGSRDWTGYSAYTWHRTKFNDWTAGYGSLGTYGSRSNGVKAVAFRKASSMVSKTLPELQIIAKQNSSAFRLLFGTGKEGAQSVLNNINKVNVPQNLSKDAMRAYRELINRVPDPTGTQAIRAQILDHLLK